VNAIAVLLLAAGAFFAILKPLFGPPQLIAQERPEEDLKNAVEKSIQELRTDLQLHKIQEEDLRAIESYLERSSHEG
jgi:hypothetical protein